MRTVNLVIWAILAVCFVGIEVAGRAGIKHLSPAGRILAPVRANTAGRAALVILWMWFGWHVFAR